jgi:ATP-binding cassette subfamily F protein 3
MSFGAAARTGDIVLRVERLNKGFDRPLVVDATFDILRGQKWGVLGPNGCGKTTLLRCIVGQQAPDSGSITLGAGVRVGYFDQLLACLEPGLALADAVRPPNKQLNDQQRRDMLARFGITGDAALQPVESLSGGQLSRAALAMLAGSEANLLLLDEPTNHLDLWARSALEDSLKAYDGTVLFVSHDRYFVNRVADHLLVFEEGRCRVIEGGYDTYLHLRAVERDGQSSARDSAQSAKSRASRSGRSGSARSGSERSGLRGGRDDGESGERRKWRFPYRSIEQLEADIASRENEIEELHQALGSSDVLRDGRRVKELAAQLRQQQEELASLYEHWEEAIERNAR